MEEAAFLFGMAVISMPSFNISLLTIPLVSPAGFWVVWFFSKYSLTPQEVFQKRDTKRSGKLDLVELHTAVQETGELTAYFGKSHLLAHES